MTLPRRQRLKPWKIDDVIDGRALRVRLTGAFQENFGNDAACRARVLELLKGAMLRGRLIAQERLEAGTGGLDCAKLLAAVQDEIISALYDFTATHIFRSRNPTSGERVSICATGGYGRYAMAPSSDVDLLFIRPAREAPWAESVIEYILYLLWDLGLKVGHASRTIGECIRAAREDMTIRTSVLEMRLIAGDSKLYEELDSRLKNELFRNSGPEFVAAKLEERDKRHARAGESRYMVEPNIKDGKGGLRDLHTMFWIAKYLHGYDAPLEFVSGGIFTRHEIRQFLEATEFLWTVRCHLHFLTGRGEEKLTFDLQPEMARRMGYGARLDNPAVERFMKHYFLTTKAVGTLTRLMVARLEAGQQKQAPKGIGRLLPFGRKPISGQLNDPRFTLNNGRIGFAPNFSVEENPIAILALFHLADKTNHDIDPLALGVISEHQALVRNLRRIKEAQYLFLETLASPNAPERSLALMNEVGVLGRFVPEFGRIVGQTQFNMYHHFTVDEHTLKGIATLSAIEHGELKNEAPITSEVFAKIANRRALFLAMLLHDVGKGEGDQEIEGAKAARAACKRLDLGEEEIELVAWLVGHHLLMSDTAQKRDLGDPETVARFAEAVGSLEKLRLLLILTVADIKAVGPGVWNDWKAQLLRDLYRLTEATLRGGRTGEAMARRLLSDQAKSTAERFINSDALAEWFSGIEDAYWLGFDDSQHSWHLGELAKALEGGLLTHNHPHVALRHDSLRGSSDLLILCKDRRGLMADVAAGLATKNISIVDARIHTAASGHAFDIFALKDNNGESLALRPDHMNAALLSAVKAILPEGTNVPDVPKIPVNRRLAAFAVQPLVSVHNDAAAYDSVIEISCRDRLGLLATLARVLQDQNLTITSAMISIAGERAEDAFYVRTTDGHKLADDAKAGLCAAVIKALDDMEPAAPIIATKRGLAKARASTRR